MFLSIDSGAQVNCLVQQIAELGKRFDRFESRSREKSRDRNHVVRNRSKTPARGSVGFCWYHNRFGDKATKCRGDCTYISNAKNE